MKVKGVTSKRAVHFVLWTFAAGWVLGTQPSLLEMVVAAVVCAVVHALYYEARNRALAGYLAHAVGAHLFGLRLLTIALTIGALVGALAPLAVVVWAAANQHLIVFAAAAAWLAAAWASDGWGTHGEPTLQWRKWSPGLETFPFQFAVAVYFALTAIHAASLTTSPWIAWTAIVVCGIGGWYSFRVLWPSLRLARRRRWLGLQPAIT